MSINDIPLRKAITTSTIRKPNPLVNNTDNKKATLQFYHLNRQLNWSIPQCMALFTAETAAEMARRSWEARRKAEQADEQTAPIPQTADEPLDFAKLRLTRVRAQLDRLDALASEETDPKRLKEYADATSRLQEQERQLAGRPLPGTLKPSSPRQQRQVGPVAPQAIQPVVGQTEPEQPK